MKRFVFRMSRLLKVRRIKEKRELAELAARQSKLQNEQMRLQQAYSYEQQLIQKISAPVGSEVNVQERWQYERMLDSHRKQVIPQHIQAVQAAERAVQEQNVKLAEARQEVKALEKLEEKQREEHRLAALAEEQIFLDDIAGGQYVRQTIEETRRVAANDLAEETAP